MSHPKTIQQLRAGIIGAGFIGPVHIEALNRLGIPVMALCDNECAIALAQKWGIPEVHPDLNHEALIASPEVDVVHIAAPNRFHFEMAKAVIEAGKHCVCEKPLAMTSAETARLVDLAAGSPGVFAVNYNVRFYPAMLQLRALVQNGELGEIFHVNGSYLQDWLLWKTDFNWRLLPGEGGRLRAVGDIGTHWMDLAGFVLGSRIAGVLADLKTMHASRLRPKGEVRTFSSGSPNPEDYEAYDVATEDYGSILLEFANGARGNLSVSQVAAGRKNCIRLEVYGSKGSAWWNSEEPNQLHLGHRDEANRCWIRNPGQMLPPGNGYSDYPAGHNEGFPDTFKMLYRNIYGSIISGSRDQALFASAEDGHHEILICEAIEKSQAERRWIDVG